MSCNPELVSAFLDNELDSVIVGAVTEHLLSCDDCVQTMTRLAAVKAVMSDKFMVHDPEGLTLSVMNVVTNDRTAPPSNGMMSFLKKLGI
ncbi:MAG: zf-HC2 domain-containing protein [Magnetococcales bacterium]|nr:zf-HC2 domain-containing protein [Magnetococcales bacterium]